MKKKALSLIMILIALALAAVGFLLLPDQVIIQLGSGGAPSRMASKTVGVLIPFALSGVGAFLYGFGEEGRQSKNLMLVPVGYAAAVFTLIIN